MELPPQWTVTQWEFKATQTHKMPFTIKQYKEMWVQDVQKMSKLQKDPRGKKYKYDPTQQCFVERQSMFSRILRLFGVKREQWVMGVNTRVPGYWHYCPIPTCRARHFVLIYQDSQDCTCVKCGEISQIRIPSKHLNDLISREKQ